MLLMVSAFITGCGMDDEYSYDYSSDYVQIGCRNRPRGEGITPPEKSCFRFGFPWWCDGSSEDNTLSGLDLSPFVRDGGKLNGLAISWMSVRRYTNGVLICPICSLQNETNGASFSLLNLSTGYCPGMQVGLVNSDIRFWEGSTGGIGVQLGLLNVASAAAAQLGVINTCYKYNIHNMIQIGVINSSVNGRIQFGLLNGNENAWFCRWFPLFNIADIRDWRD